MQVLGVIVASLREVKLRGRPSGVTLLYLLVF